MPNQMMPKINLLQMPDPAARTAKYANMMNMASQQRAAQLQSQRTEQGIKFDANTETREAAKFDAEQPVRVAGALGGGLINILRDPSDASIMQAGQTFASVGMEPDKYEPILKQIMGIADPNERKLFVTQFVAQSEPARAALGFVMPKTKEIKVGDDTVVVDDNANSETFGQELFRINVTPEPVSLNQQVVGEKLFNVNPRTGVAAEALIGDPNQGLTPAARPANLISSGVTSRYAVGGGTGATPAQPRMGQPVTPTAPAAVGVQTSRGAPGSGKDTFKIMIGMESRGQQFAKSGAPLTSPKGAIGIAQIMPGTAPEAAKLAGLPYDKARLRNDKAYNLALGEAYFEKQLRDFGDNRLAAAAYNAGPGAVRRALAKGGPDGWINHVPRETQKYVAQIPGGGGAPASNVSSAAPAGAGTPTGTGTGTPLTVSESVKLPGKKRVSNIVADMIKEYDILNNAKAIPSSQRGAMENIFDYVSVSGPGQEIQKAFGTKANDSLSNITNARKLLTSAIAAATGMSSKQMDSNRELQLTLDSLSDPTQGYKSVIDTLRRLDREYGMGNTSPRTPTPAAGGSKGKGRPSLDSFRRK
jgi:hypothetical protein